MSKIIGRKKYLFSSKIGTVVVDQKLIEDPDVEDMMADLAITQARNLQFKTIGRQIDANANLPQESIPAVFLDPSGFDEDEELL